MKPGRLFLILILAAALSSCSSFLISFFGYGQHDIKDNCITPEPGTTVSVRCRLITEIGRDYFSIDSKEILLPRQKLLQKFKPSIRSTKDLSIRSGHDSIRLRLYCNIPKHKRAGLPVILYIHGGGFVRGSIDNFEGYCVKIAKKTGGLVVSVDYHLAPENPFPCAVCDCYNALKWTAANCESYGGSDRRIIVMGGSAGGNLAAVMPIVCRDSCGPSISGQVLCYPSTSLRHTKYMSREYFAQQDNYYILSNEFLKYCREAYINEESEALNPYVSPLEAELSDDMPDALVITAQCDPLRDEGRLYAEKLRKSGIHTEFIEYKHMTHAFMPFYPIIKSAREAIDVVADFVAVH